MFRFFFNSTYTVFIPYHETFLLLQKYSIGTLSLLETSVLICLISSISMKLRTRMFYKLNDKCPTLICSCNICYC